jgi:hypothetical protein
MPFFYALNINQGYTSHYFSFGNLVAAHQYRLKSGTYLTNIYLMKLRDFIWNLNHLS